ncbi:alpha-L-arabinofuranosidase [Dinghuibacter silviterrae]|uniref:Alpha-L-arabinofuranosidase n=1 Tax=Dinghuibacter silviterrae TaxID=1539049 RepID=A0A4R8DQ86_9BACT|nr:alpha-L-arabinofuranosidase [Dinghuibacter silviterrae]TDX00300.1 hypothetical protein EDB95_1321 [Dinghuibacter silviterrae]
MMKPTLFAALVAICVFAACAKHAGTSNSGSGSTTDTVITPPTDPAVSATVGFFLNDWTPKTFTVPSTTAGTVGSTSYTDELTIDISKVLTKVSPYVYGNNTNLWMGQIVTQSNLVGYIKDLSPNILRAPAGSNSDIYFWNQASAPPSDAPVLLYSNGTEDTAGYWYGGNTQSWTLSLSNYYALQAATSSGGIITVNYGYARYGTSADPVAAAAHLAADWVRYDKGKSKFWEIGNETYGNWEAGYQIDQSLNHDNQPQFVTGDLYGQHVKVFVDSMRAAAQEVGSTIYIGATLLDAAPYTGAYQSLLTWNQGVLTEAGNLVDFFEVHDYFTPYNDNTSEANILASATTVPTNAMTYLNQQMAQYGVTPKPIALTEWNIQAVNSKQDVSYIAGVHAVKALGSIIKNHFGEASRWDLANGWNGGNDMGMFSEGGEPNVPLWNPRPVFFYLYYFQKFFGDRMVSDTLQSTSSDLTTYSSSFTSGQAGTIVVNSGTTAHTLAIDFKNFAAGSHYYWYVLTGGTDVAQFSGQVVVNGTGPNNAEGGPASSYASIKAYTAPLTGTIYLSVPARAVVYLVADKKS